MARQPLNDQEASTQLRGAAHTEGGNGREPPLDLTDPAHQRTLIDAAVATLPPSRPSPRREVDAGCPIGPHPEHASVNGADPTSRVVDGVRDGVIPLGAWRSCRLMPLLGSR